jgi:hypothetical protein
VDASDDYIYAADPGNITMVRFQKTFVLDNVPSMGSSVALLPAKIRGAVSLASFPNPLMPSGRISLILPLAARLTLDVVDASGRVVWRVAGGSFTAGAHLFAWRGSASGVFFLRLRSDCGNLARKIVMAR